MPLLTYYGDDFTGSTDVMEALASHGIETVLFTRIPNADEASRFEGHEAFGIAGVSRSQTPAWMDAYLPEIFRWLKSRQARFCHYKVCSTFDSSPSVGSIGRALEIGRDIFEQDLVPMVVGAPQLKRYTAFGHLFAGYQGEVYRIDRHPVMSRHPVTPMHEADIGRHLAGQTSLPYMLVPLTALGGGDADGAVDELLKDRDGMVLFDVLDHAAQVAAGRQLLRLSDNRSLFTVGSSGIEYALLKALHDQGKIAGEARFNPLPPVERTIVVSGSCSPTSARQVRHALASGFAGIEADPVSLATAPAYVDALAKQAVAHVNAGRSVIAYTSLDGATRGDDLDSIPGARDAAGKALGALLCHVVKTCRLKRVVVAGGDTSSHALGELDIFALTTRLPLKQSPGSPLCTAHSNDPAFHGMEIALKGGQVGGDDYFVMLRDGLPGV